MKKGLIFVIVILAIGLGAWGAVKLENRNKNEVKTEDSSNDGSANSGQDQTNGDILLFTGDGCPHCKNVEEWIEKNDIKSKVDFQQKEVWYNKENADLMNQKADVCKLDKDELGVPMLFDGAKCYIGEVDIQNFFKEKAGI